MAGLTILVYDHFITFDDEVRQYIPNFVPANPLSTFQVKYVWRSSKKPGGLSKSCHFIKYRAHSYLFSDVAIFDRALHNTHLQYLC